jgi:hypothetical protein
VLKLHECEIDRLHPTQITVGMIEVEDKRKHIEAARALRQAFEVFRLSAELRACAPGLKRWLMARG